MTRIVSLAALTVLELDPAARVRCAAEAGYRHIGLRLIAATPTEAQYDLISDGPLRRELARALAETGVQVLDAEIFRLKPETQVADYEPALAVAAELGARDLLVAGNDADEARLSERFAELCDLAARHGLGSNLEFMPWTDARDLPQAARVVARAARPNAAVLVDAFHLSRSGGTVAEVAALPRSQLRFLQLCDVPARVPATMDEILHEARAERRFPGEGELDLLGLLQAVPADLPLSIEVPTHTLARTVGAVERARRALQGTQRLLATLEAHAA